MSSPTRNWFTQGGDAYARYRPDYPRALAEFLARAAPCTQLAVDVGCGSGQLTLQLAGFFDAVIGLDPSADQVAHAASHERVQYRVAPAESLDVGDRCACLVTAAQAAHWFDLSRFYDEVRRVSIPGAMLALISYGSPRLEGEVGHRFETFDAKEVGPYWPPERQLVDSGYASLPFPFREYATPRLEIRREWDAPALLGYVSTWSATRRARDAGKHDVLERFATELLALWGEPTQPRTVVWPIAIRLGKMT